MGLGWSSQSASSDVLAKQHVIVVGGGYGGVKCALELKKAGVPYTLIDPKAYFHHNLGALRAVVTPEFAKKTVIPFDQTFGKNFVQGSVTNIDVDGRTVTVDSGKSIHFTHLVLCTGSFGAYPARTEAPDIPEALEESESTSEEVKKASRIIIIGGGSVGVELAGEIKVFQGQNINEPLQKLLKRFQEIYPEKEVTILTSGNEVLSSITIKDPQKLQKQAKELLEYVGVQLKFGEKVTNLDELKFGTFQPQTIKTLKGNSFDADLVFNCTGLKPNVGLIQRCLGSSVIDTSSNRVKVNSVLLVEGLEDKNVFAIGDCCNTKEEKMAAHAGRHAEYVVKNILNDLSGRPRQPYTAKFDGMVVTVGKTYGVGSINGWRAPMFVWGLLKSRTLFTEQFWSDMEQKIPS